jgi:hypothetical protein
MIYEARGHVIGGGDRSAECKTKGDAIRWLHLILENKDVDYVDLLKVGADGETLLMRIEKKGTM